MTESPNLPFFPLGLVAFPGEVVNLHIFEPRYRELFAELEEAGTTFVIIPHIEARLKSVGTEMRLKEVAKRYPSGELDVRVEGVGVVDVLDFQDPLPGKLYAGGAVQRRPRAFDAPDTQSAKLLRERCTDLQLSLRVHTELPNEDEPGLSFKLGHRMGLSLQEEFRLLTIDNEPERQEFLLRAVERAIKTAKTTEEMRHRVQMNGHFRYIQS